MGVSVGIVGLPNVGKSTLFNALTRLQAEASNYPFCTIDPNVGVVEVPDERLAKLAEVVHPQKIVPAAIEFVDIAGLVRNAHEGEGLGNQFLGHIRAVDAICHVVRNFGDPNVVHVEGSVDARRDIETIKYELALADVSTVSKRIERTEKLARTGDKDKLRDLELCRKIKSILDAGQLVSEQPEFAVDTLKEGDLRVLQELSLLTAKPVMYVVNVSEEEIASFDVKSFIQAAGLRENDTVIPISARVEAELNELAPAEAAEYLASLGLTQSGLVRLAQSGYALLGLLTYFTAGDKEVKAWTVRKGAKAPQAAGVIHTDFEAKFIRAEVIGWEKLVEAGSYVTARDKGWIRTEGKEYLVQDGDTMHFLHGA